MPRTRYEEGDGSIERARELRKNPTPAERRLWSALRGSAVEGAKFRKQQRLGPYFADFACLASRLIVEVDGDTHSGEGAEKHDANRTAFMEREGYRVIRFSNSEVMGNLDGVVQIIRTSLSVGPSPSHSASPNGPLPLPLRGEG